MEAVDLAARMEMSQSTWLRCPGAQAQVPTPPFLSGLNSNFRFASFIHPSTHPVFKDKDQLHLSEFC